MQSNLHIEYLSCTGCRIHKIACSAFLTITYCNVAFYCYFMYQSSYLNLSFVAGFTADWLDNRIFGGPNFIIIYLQASVVPTANINVVVVVLSHLFEIHYFIPVDKKAHIEDTSGPLMHIYCHVLWPCNPKGRTWRVSMLIRYCVPARWVSILIK